MGPQLYVTPPGSYTAFHQDGKGNVDSGHLCLCGCNEVVILGRLPEMCKRDALRRFAEQGPSEHNDEDATHKKGKYQESRADIAARNRLYSQPHGAGGNENYWPTRDTVASWKKKGCVHAPRKRCCSQTHCFFSPTFFVSCVAKNQVIGRVWCS